MAGANRPNNAVRLLSAQDHRHDFHFSSVRDEEGAPLWWTHPSSVHPNVHEPTAKTSGIQNLLNGKSLAPRDLLSSNGDH